MFDMGVDPNDPRGGAGYGGGQPFGGFDMGDVFGQFFDAFGGGTGNVRYHVASLAAISSKSSP